MDHATELDTLRSLVTWHRALAAVLTEALERTRVELVAAEVRVAELERELREVRGCNC